MRIRLLLERRKIDTRRAISASNGGSGFFLFQLPELTGICAVPNPFALTPEVSADRMQCPTEIYENDAKL